MSIVQFFVMIIVYLQKIYINCIIINYYEDYWHFKFILIMLLLKIADVCVFDKRKIVPESI